MNQVSDWGSNHFPYWCRSKLWSKGLECRKSFKSVVQFCCVERPQKRFCQQICISGIIQLSVPLLQKICWFSRSQKVACIRAQLDALIRLLWCKSPYSLEKAKVIFSSGCSLGCVVNGHEFALLRGLGIEVHLSACCRSALDMSPSLKQVLQCHRGRWELSQTSGVKLKALKGAHIKTYIPSCLWLFEWGSINLIQTVVNSLKSISMHLIHVKQLVV